MENIIISTDKSLLSIQVIQDFLNNISYWGKNRTIEQIKDSIDNSFCFGVYIDNQQIGFGRAVTDFATFYYLADIFILPEYQNKGIGKKLMKYIVEHPKLNNLLGVLLTRTAHSIYKEFGFSSDDKRIAERVMVKFN